MLDVLATRAVRFIMDSVTPPISTVSWKTKRSFCHVDVTCNDSASFQSSWMKTRVRLLSPSRRVALCLSVNTALRKKFVGVLVGVFKKTLGGSKWRYLTSRQRCQSNLFSRIQIHYNTCENNNKGISCCVSCSHICAVMKTKGKTNWYWHATL